MAKYTKNLIGMFYGILHVLKLTRKVSYSTM